MDGWMDGNLYIASGSDSYCTPALYQARSWVLKTQQSPAMVPTFKQLQAGFLSL